MHFDRVSSYLGRGKSEANDRNRSRRGVRGLFPENNFGDMSYTNYPGTTFDFSSYGFVHHKRAEVNKNATEPGFRICVGWHSQTLCTSNTTGICPFRCLIFATQKTYHTKVGANDRTYSSTTKGHSAARPRSNLFLSDCEFFVHPFRGVVRPCPR